MRQLPHFNSAFEALGSYYWTPEGHTQSLKPSRLADRRKKGTLLPCFLVLADLRRPLLSLFLTTSKLPGWLPLVVGKPLVPLHGPVNLMVGFLLSLP